MTAKKESEKKHALYLVDPSDDGDPRPQLIHADEVEEKQAAGWKQPEGMRANGAGWNEEDDLLTNDAQAETNRTRAEWQGDKDEKKAEELAANAKAAEAAKAEAENKPDMKVQIVDPPKPAKK